MELKYLYMPTWRHGAIEGIYYIGEYQRVLHYRNSPDESWRRVECEDWPSHEEMKKRISETNPNIK